MNTLGVKGRVLAAIALLNEAVAINAMTSELTEKEREKIRRTIKTINDIRLNMEGR